MNAEPHTDHPLEPLARASAAKRSSMGLAIALALLLHLGAALALAHLAARHQGPPPAAAETVEIDLAPTPEPPPPVPTEPPNVEVPAPEKVESPTPHKADAPARRLVAKAPAAPPSPGRAAAVITRKDEPDEPVDLTNAIVAGSATTYAGGSTASSGTNPNAVRGASSLLGTTTGSSSSTLAGGRRIARWEQSRAPSLAGDRSWSCPFPPEADAEGVNDAVVTIRVSVDAAGHVGDVNVVKDPGHGFGREARRCAISKRWAPGLDAEGSPTSGTATVNVRFSR